MTQKRHTAFEEFWNSYMYEGPGEGWFNEYSDVYQCAEQFMFESTPEELRAMLTDIDTLFELPDEQARRQAIPFDLNDIRDDNGAFDSFLVDFRARVERQLAGDHSQPLVDTRPPLPEVVPLSPQGYDVSLPSAGSFDNVQIAEAVVDAVLKAYGDRLRTSFEDSQPGVTRRMPPLRMRFDREVGLVAVRDGEPVRTRLAVVLVQDIGGEAHVFNAFPMEEVPAPPELEALSVLCGGWLHADWVDDYLPGPCDPVEQVRRFAAQEPLETVEDAADQLAALRAAGTEDDRRRAIRGLCSFFLPRPEGQLDAFLADAAQVLAEAVPSRRG